MKPTPGRWLAFTILFLIFGIYHIVQLVNSVPRFEWATSHETVGDIYSPLANETRKNVVSFIGQWNKYVDQQNRNLFCLNIIIAITYFISAYMAFDSIGFNDIKSAARYCRQKYSDAKAFMVDKWKTKKHVKKKKNIDCRKGHNPDE